MSSVPATDLGTMPGDEVDPRAGLSFMAQVFSEAYRRWGARLGTVWIAVIAIGAVFSPFLASSHPFVIKSRGVMSFPLFRHLGPVDIVLPVAAITALVVGLRRSMKFSQALALICWASAVTAAAACWPSIPGYRADLAGLVGPVTGMSLLVLLCGALLCAVVLLPLVIPRGALIWTGALLLPLVVFLIAAYPVRPPVTVVYSQYREDTKEGLIDWAFYPPLRYSPSDRLRDQGDTSFLPPGREHPMGTDYNGSDVLSRMIHACRIALAIGLISTGIARLIGIAVGGVMGYFVGRTDIIGMRIIEIFEAIPTLFLLITFVAFYGRNLYAMMVIIGITSWPGTARFIRAEFLSLRKQDFVQAAIASGLPLRSVLFRHMLPNGVTPVLVTASFGIAAAILYESTLSFLGLGLIDEPSWGQMLNQARGVGASFVWWIAIFPGLAIFLTVLSYNLIGEALRDALDPKLKKTGG